MLGTISYLWQISLDWSCAITPYFNCEHVTPKGLWCRCPTALNSVLHRSKPCGSIAISRPSCGAERFRTPGTSPWNHTFPGAIWKSHPGEILVLAAYLPGNILQSLWNRTFVKDLKLDHFHYFFMINMKYFFKSCFTASAFHSTQY